MYLKLTGTGGSTLTVPTNTKLYFIFNSTASAITVKTSGAGVSVPAGAKTVLLCDGTDIVVAENYLASLTLGAALPVASGGTGATSTTAYAVYTGNSAGTGFTPIAPSTSGNLLTSNGTSWASTAPAAPPTSVTSLAGTANQITASAATGAVTLSVPSNSNGYGVRTVSSSGPSGGSNGDIWYRTA
jgi:hypothetical protein